MVHSRQRPHPVHHKLVDEVVSLRHEVTRARRQDDCHGAAQRVARELHLWKRTGVRVTKAVLYNGNSDSSTKEITERVSPAFPTSTRAGSRVTAAARPSPRPLLVPESPPEPSSLLATRRTMKVQTKSNQRKISGGPLCFKNSKPTSRSLVAANRAGSVSGLLSLS